MSSAIPFIFLDNEASSLTTDSYPIEIAWVRQDGSNECFLIRPEPEWTDWSEQAEALHGLSREQLMKEGHPASEVAARFLCDVKGARLVSDAPPFDRAWLETLCGVAGKTTPVIHPVLEAWVEALRTHEGSSAQEEAALLTRVRRMEESRRKRRHRALPDAQELWRIWKDLGGR
ncbi:3'-5' exonuclease [Acetobacter conturbans]|uniref:Transcriptional regulator n=1 Tax=Acetobacter conturbans TaxID=1737472 RepID=A0ABX0JZJ0_9PROT|nr:transcriptional regulator [Acetobacter conturbans]NHN88814.1 transcriptional regulator [Acetobacter conturbans]